ncbi:MAG: metal-dependent transcriptional regulator [Candidatus Aenigmarchaeota archaeon]|nr:metal-dependent transcriptional regulator [Candidatus Aenigmarchaeota archaeon]
MMKLTRSLEDYLKNMYLIEQSKGFVRLKDLVKKLNVKPSSVNHAVKKLSEEGLISYEKYGYIKLTEKGKKSAKSVYSRHEIIFKFLTEMLGVNEKTAKKEACVLEHHLSKKTIEKISNLLKQNKIGR